MGATRGGRLTVVPGADYQRECCYEQTQFGRKILGSGQGLGFRDLPFGAVRPTFALDRRPSLVDPIRGDRRQVGIARRTKGIGTLLSGLRHRLPIELVNTDGSVLCTVRRSRALKGDVKRYTVLGSDDAPIGQFFYRSEKGPQGRSLFFVDILDGEGVVLATRSWAADRAGFRFDETASRRTLLAWM